MTEQQPAPEVSAPDISPTRLRDRSWSFTTAVSACVAALLVGGLVGASLGALAAGGDDRSTTRQARHGQQAPGRQWEGQRWQGQPPGSWDDRRQGSGDRRGGMDRGGPDSLGPLSGLMGGLLGDADLDSEQTQELLTQMRELLRQWRESAPGGQAPGTAAPTPAPTAPSPSEGASKS